MTRKKILHVIGGSQFGGIVPYVASLVKMARQNDFDAEVLATAPRVVEYYQQRGIKVVSVQGIDREISFLRDISGLLMLVYYLRKQSYTIVHTHTSKGGIIGRLAAYLAGVPVIIHTTQGYAFKDYASTKFMSWFFYRLEKMATGWCDLIIAANKNDRDLAIQTGIVTPDKIITVKNCIDLESIDNTSNNEIIYQSLGISKDNKIVGVMARLSQQKGLEYFVESLPKVLKEFPSVQILIVGEGDLLSQLKDKVDELGVAASVIFAGFRSDWIEVLRVIDVFVMPSLWEGLPITLLGAMATSKAIVATRIKGITDVCDGDDVAILVEPADSDALAHSIMRFLQDELLAKQYGLAARRRVEMEYSEDVMNERIWTSYKYLLNVKHLL